jgi:hypothetical protein
MVEEVQLARWRVKHGYQLVDGVETANVLVVWLHQTALNCPLVLLNSPTL